MTRQSIVQKGWMRGSSPRMTSIETVHKRLARLEIRAVNT
jgi:hypothetical protein